MLMMVGAALITYSEKVKERKVLIPPASAVEAAR